MRRSILGFTTAVFLLANVPLFGLATNVIDDVIRMTSAGVAEETIVTFIEGDMRPFEVTADDMIALKNAKVSQKVVQALLDRSAALKKAAAQTAENAPATEAAQQAEDENHDVLWLPPWIPDYLVPFWYLPRLDTKSGKSAVKKPAARRAEAPVPPSSPLARPSRDTAPSGKPAEASNRPAVPEAKPAASNGGSAPAVAPRSAAPAPAAPSARPAMHGRR